MRIWIYSLVILVLLGSVACGVFVTFFSMMFTEFNYNFDLGTRSPSILPMTAMLKWYDPDLNKTSHSIGRYATFGPIIDTDLCEKNDTFDGRVLHIKQDGCDLSSLQSMEDDFQDAIVLNERGGCSFYDKVLNFQKVGAKAVIIGNDQFKRGLLTMFSKIIPEEVVIPSIFITKETLVQLSILAEHHEVILHLYSGQTPSPLLDALLTLVFSPPIALSILYIILRFRRSHKVQFDKAPKESARSLPVFIYNEDYLIPIKEFENKQDFYTESSSLLGFFHKDSTPHLPTEELNQYKMKQCSICLATYRKLKSKVVLLPCHHYFHHKCCINWLVNYHKFCPVCKQDITKKPRASSSFSARSILNIFHSEEPRMVDRGTSPGFRELNYNSINTHEFEHGQASVDEYSDGVIIDSSDNDSNINEVDGRVLSQPNNVESPVNEDEEQSIGSWAYY